MKILKLAHLRALLKRPSQVHTNSALNSGASLLYASIVVSIILHSLILLIPGHGLNLKSESTIPGFTQNTVIKARFVDRSAGPEMIDTGNQEKNMEDEANTAPFKPNFENETKQTPLPDSLQPIASPSAKSEVSARPEFEQDFVAKYPFMALSKGIRGSVRASFRLGKDGAIEDIKIIDSTPSGVFDTAVVLALTNARIKPESVQQNSRLTVTVVFDPSGTNSYESLTQ